MINWKVRLKNPVWWASVAVAVVAPMLACMGVHWGDMTSWQALGHVFAEAFGDPVVVVAMAVSIWNTVVDPTTRGLSDSLRALGYNEPYDESAAGTANTADGGGEA